MLNLPETLSVSADKYLEMYNLDVVPYLERHKFKESAQKGQGGAINYISYTHAIRILKTNFPGFKTEFVVNPLTNGALFKELDERGYFVLVYIHNGYERSEILYYPLLTVSGLAIPCVEKYDSKGLPVYNSKIDSQAINKAIARAYCKIIAFVTGAGLKLWTGDDLAQEVLDDLTEQKKKYITGIGRLLSEYRDKFNQDLMLPDSNGNLKPVRFTINMTEYELKELGQRIKQELHKEVPLMISHADLLLNQSESTIDITPS